MTNNRKCEKFIKKKQNSNASILSCLYVYTTFDLQSVLPTATPRNIHRRRGFPFRTHPVHSAKQSTIRHSSSSLSRCECDNYDSINQNEKMNVRRSLRDRINFQFHTETRTETRRLFEQILFWFGKRNGDTWNTFAEHTLYKKIL